VVVSLDGDGDADLAVRDRARRVVYGHVAVHAS
jgi:hypothetical protein